MSALPIQSTIGQLHGAGLVVSLTPDKGLRVSPASGITPALRELIRINKAALVDYLQATVSSCNIAANDTPESFVEPSGYEGTGWRLAGAEGLSQATLCKFRMASLALDASQAIGAVSRLELS